MSKLDINSNPLSFDELVQQQINKYYHYRNSDDDEEDEEEGNLKEEGPLDKLHEEHTLWLKKKKKDSKTMAPIIERLRMFIKTFISNKLFFCLSEELHDHLQILDVK
jgi:hypothetical protein